MDQYEYYLSSDKASWADAQAACVTKGGFLATLDTAEKVAFVNTLMDDAGFSGQPVWFGCKQTDDFASEEKDGGVFTFVNGRGSCTKDVAAYTAWDDDQPDNAGSFEDCVYIGKEGRWNDAPCGDSEQEHYICERVPTFCTQAAGSVAPTSFTTAATFTSRQQMEADGWTFSTEKNFFQAMEHGLCPDTMPTTSFCGWDGDEEGTSEGTITKRLSGTGKLTLTLSNRYTVTDVWVEFNGIEKLRLAKGQQQTLSLSFVNGDELLIGEEEAVIHIISLTFEYACEEIAPTNILLGILPEVSSVKNTQDQNQQGPKFLTDGQKPHASYNQFWQSATSDNTAWAKVTFKQRSLISRVQVTNRCDCCDERLTGARVYIGQSADGDEMQCGDSIPAIGACEDAVLSCNITGYYVVIRKSNSRSPDKYSDTLNIAELEAYGMPYHGALPLPINEEVTIPMVDTNGTTQLDGAFWKGACQKVPADALYIVVDMGSTRDLFRPVEGNSWCQMLTAPNKHQWSEAGKDWKTPNYHSNSNMGGSAVDWPKNGVGGDARRHLSMWGTDESDTKGGCCSSSFVDYVTLPTTTNNTYGWGQPFTMAFGVNPIELGLLCASDAHCISNSCHTYCCAKDQQSTTDSCSFCDNVDGSCYTPLVLATTWKPTTLTDGWQSVYNKDQSARLAGPPDDFPSTAITNARGSAREIRFRLMWSTDVISTDEFNSGTPPLAGIVHAGEGADPGLFDVDTKTGMISALPKRNGNYTLFLIAEDGAGTATTLGLPEQLDQVIVKRLDFTVVGKPDFVVTSYTRNEATSLPPVAAGEAPFIAAARVGSIECVVGTMYHIAPINTTTLVYAHASGGGEGAKIRFTIRNPPPGFFIEPDTGEIQGNPQANSATETFKSTLLAIDPAGQEAVLETMTFTILPKPRFVPVFETERTTLSSVDEEYIDPTMYITDIEPFVVGTSYKIATFILNTTTTRVSAGAVDDITYTLSSDAPESFCVQANSGDISGTFPSAGNYSFGVLAVDQAGATAVVEQLDIVVLDRPVFEVAVSALRVRNGSEFSDPSAAASSTFYVDESYRFSPLVLLEHATIVSAGSFDSITYTLSADDGWFVSAPSGEIFGQFGSVGNHTMKLFAVDLAGKQALVEEMQFVVQPRPVFGLGTTFDPSVLSPKDVGLELAATLAPTTIQYAIGSTVKFPPLPQSVSELFVNPAFGDFAKITYKRTFSGADGTTKPGLWLVDTETGEMLAQPERAGNYTVSLTATDGLGAEVTVRSWQFEVLLRDADVQCRTLSLGACTYHKYGPNRDDCKNSGIRVDDAEIFDQQFACNCVGTGYEGDNCEVKIQSAVCAATEALVDGVCRPFQLATNQEGVRTKSGAEFTDPHTMENQYYTVRDFASYRIAPLVIDAALTNYSAGNRSDVTYTMTGNTDGFFLNTKTGQMLGTFDSFDEEKSATKTYAITLQAVDGGGVNQDLETLTMRVRYPDLKVDEYGPNNATCQNNGTRMDELDGSGDKYDQSYVCKCAVEGYTSYSGENCEIVVEVANSQAGSGNISLVAGVMASGVVLIFIVAAIIYKRRMHAFSMRAFDFEAELARMVAAGDIDAQEDGAADGRSRVPREIKRGNITTTNKLGEGAFGEVWKGVLDESSSGGVPGYLVAVKTSKEAQGEGADEMLREATVMAQVTGHPNLVSLIGVVTSGAPLLLLLSFCENGALLNYLQDAKAALKTPTQAVKVKMAAEIAAGMAHLIACKFVHRDLASRNVLLDSEKVCKIADFGLARGTAGASSSSVADGDEEDYYRSRTGTFPVRWTDPNAMQTMRFSELSDVWSFAVTVLEIFIDGSKPYPKMKNAEVITKVQAGYRAPQPDGCPPAVYGVMLQCWAEDSATRPRFAKIADLLREIVGAAGSESIQESANPIASNSSSDDYATPVSHNPAHDSNDESHYNGSRSAPYDAPAPAPPVRRRSSRGAKANGAQQQHENQMGSPTAGNINVEDEDAYLTPVSNSNVAEMEFLQAISAVNCLNDADTYLTVSTHQQHGGAAAVEEFNSDINDSDGENDEYLTVSTTHNGFEEDDAAWGDSDISEDAEV
jgi:serine/threonine protein kinase